MLNIALCRKLAQSFCDAIACDFGSWAESQYLAPLSRELGQDTAGTLKFLRGLPREQFEQLMAYAPELIDAFVGNKKELFDGMYLLAKERGADESTMDDVNAARNHASK